MNFLRLEQLYSVYYICVPPIAHLANLVRIMIAEPGSCLGRYS